MHQQPLLAIGHVGQAVPVRTEQAGRRILVAHRVVDTGEIDGVLDAARHHRLLIVGRARVTPAIDGHAGAVTARELRVKDQTRTADGRPPLLEHVVQVLRHARPGLARLG